MAQHGFALLLELANSIAGRAASLRDGYWQTGVPDSYGIYPHFELAGRTFGVVGYGAIGRAAARIARGFGMRVLVYTRHVKPEYAADGVEFVPFDRLLEDSDVVSLHCPSTAETRGMIDKAALAAMKPGAILLNTARGALVDEAAVCAALKSGHLGYYASDVAAHEPVRPKDGLLHCPNVLLTPHVAWATEERWPAERRGVRQSGSLFAGQKAQPGIRQQNKRKSGARPHGKRKGAGGLTP